MHSDKTSGNEVANFGESPNLTPAAPPTVKVSPSIAARYGIRAGDSYAQIDANRAGYFRGALPAQVVELGTICQLQLTFADGEHEAYFAPMVEPEKWRDIQAKLRNLGTTLEIVAVAVAIIERAAGGAQ